MADRHVNYMSSVRRRLKGGNGDKTPVKINEGNTDGVHVRDVVKGAENRHKKAPEGSIYFKEPMRIAKFNPQVRTTRNILTDEVKQIICDALHCGLFRENVAKLISVAPSTLEKWISKGRQRNTEISDWHEQASVMSLDEGKSEMEVIKELGHPPQRTIFTELDSDVMEAEGTAERGLWGVVWNSALGGDVDAAQWALERKYPRRYGRGVASGMIVTATETVKDGDAVKELTLMLTTFKERAGADLESSENEASDG